MINLYKNILKNYLQNEGNTISLLQDIQELFGYIPRDAIEFFSEKLNLPPSHFYGVATFYSQFRLSPVGKNKITACCGTACHVRGAERITNGLRRELGLSDDEDTTKDGEFTLEKVACLGTCSFAPVVLVNNNVYGRVNIDKILKVVKTIRKKNE